MKLIKTEEAVGSVLCHDLTQIIKGVTKDAVFRKGHVIREEDIPQMVAWALREANPTYPVPVLYDEAHCAEVIRWVAGK